VILTLAGQMSLVAIVKDEVMSVGKHFPLKPTAGRRNTLLILAGRLLLPICRLSRMLSLTS